jgi:hypothetical protein
VAVGTGARAKRTETAWAAVEDVLQRSPRLRPLAGSPSGGLTQIPQGGSAIRVALSCLGAPQDVALAGPPLPPSPNQGLISRLTSISYAIWISDEGWLYTPTLHHHWNIPLERLLLVRVKDAMDVWRLALEAVQTGLFQWAILRPSRLCPTGYLRKIQLTAESTRCQIIVLSEERLPHWVLRKTKETKETQIADARTVSPSPGPPDGVQRGLPRSLP